MNDSIEISGESHNHSLFSLISVIYGAVFSYAMYVFSQLLIKLSNECKPFNLVNIYHSTAAKQIFLFFIFIIYMIEDIGSVFKIANRFQFKRANRYTFEIFISLCYISSFSLLEEAIFYCLASFAIIIILGGIWYNQFKIEYKTDPSNVSSFAKWERNFHYAGGIILACEIAIFVYMGSGRLRWLTVGIFSLTVFLWMAATSVFSCMFHGRDISKCRMMVLIKESYRNKLFRDNQTVKF